MRSLCWIISGNLFPTLSNLFKKKVTIDRDNDNGDHSKLPFEWLNLFINCYQKLVDIINYSIELIWFNPTISTSIHYQIVAGQALLVYGLVGGYSGMQAPESPYFLIECSNRTRQFPVLLTVYHPSVKLSLKEKKQLIKDIGKFLQTIEHGY